MHPRRERRGHAGARPQEGAVDHLLGDGVAAARRDRHCDRAVLAVSWLGVWLWLPPMARAVALFVFLVLTAAATVPLILVRFPSRHDGLRRLDREAGISHRPATAIADELATSKSDPWSVALWRAHVERALLAAQRLGRAGRRRVSTCAIRWRCAPWC